MKHLVILMGLCFVLSLGGCALGTRVRSGDTLYSISRKHNVPLRGIIEENNLPPPYIIRPGQYLWFPRNRTYRVRKGDTLYSIAQKYDMTVNALARHNQIPPPYQIKPGQLLKISSWSGETTMTTFAGQKKTSGTKMSSSFTGKASVPKSQSKKRFSWPVATKNIISDFGNGNEGINIAGKVGTPVTSADAGTVAYAGNALKGYGNLVLIKHKNGWITAYAHNNKLLVKKGQSVIKGQKIAEMGATGNVRSPQLHFEVRYKAKVVNPHHYLQ